MDEIKTISISGKNISYIFDRLVHIMTENSDDADFYAYSAFLMLLTELDILNTDDSRLDYTKSNRLITSLTEYISDNLSDDLTINMLSEKFHISPSGITHMFKNEIGISLHKYITQKRLLNARKLIIEGSRPTEIYQDAGFRDYSAFYKSYVSFFGYPPSKEKYINAH